MPRITAARAVAGVKRSATARLACARGHDAPDPLTPSCSAARSRRRRPADAVAEIVGLGPRVGADPHLVECARTAAAHHRAQQARILVADHGAQPLHRARIHRQRLVAVEAGGELHAPELGGGELHMLLELGDEGIGRALQQRHQFAATGRRRALAAPCRCSRPCPLVDARAGDGERRSCGSPPACRRCRRAIPAPGAARHCRPPRQARDCRTGCAARSRIPPTSAAPAPD